ncbi:MAG: QueG-associated DUF1730 domain-containing protein [Candidatus Krumholzibacteriia bacterium]
MSADAQPPVPPPRPEPVQATATALALRLAEICPPAAVDLAGAVALPAALPHADAWQAYVREGRHAGLEYLARDPEARADPHRAHPWARSVLVFGQRYTDGWDHADRSPWRGAVPGRPWIDGVARYARGRDYHDVLLRAVRRVVRELGASWPGLVARVAVDTGPYLEREYAWLAGLGFLGKNTCLIHERLGSGLFLGVALTNLDVSGLPPAGVPATEPLYGLAPRSRAYGRDPAGDRPAPLTLCGRCTLCLEACPTGALAAAHVMDARLCIATWTIEWRGRAPADRRRQQGGLLFGCDICQAACPWNHASARRTGLPPWPAEYRPSPEHTEIRLADLAVMARERFRERFRRTPLWRAHPDGLRRNALVVAANTGRGELVDEARRLAASDPDAEVRDVAEWARRRLEDPRAPGEGRP